ncbi:MAG: hypothetical protein U0903_09440 [Planctomycetales bacterium]
MSENSPETGIATQSPRVYRSGRRRLTIVIAVCLLGLVTVPLLMWLVSSNAEPTDTYLVTWQVLLDDQATAEFLKSVKEVPSNDPEWEAMNSPPQATRVTHPNGPKDQIPVTYYGGSGEEVRTAMRDVLASSAINFPPTKVVWSIPAGLRSAQAASHPLVSLTRVFFPSAGLRRVNSFLPFGFWEGKSLTDWKNANQNFFQILPDVRQGGALLSRDRLQVEMRGDIKLQNFKFQREKGETESAIANIDCKMIFKRGNALVMVTRFSQKLPAPVLVTVCERVDLPPGRHDIMVQQSFSRWIQNGPELVRKTSDALLAWENQVSQKEIVPGAKWTQTLPDGRAVTLIAVTQQEKYPNFKWSPDGHPLPRYIPSHSEAFMASESRNNPRVIFRVMDSADPNVAMQAITAAELEVTGYRTSGDVAYALSDSLSLANPATKGLVQYASLPAKVLPDGKGEAEIISGFGPWKPFGNVTTKDSQPASVSLERKPFHLSVYEYAEQGLIKLNANVTVFKNVPLDEELRLRLVTKSGQRITGDYPPGIYPLPAGSSGNSRGLHQQFSGYKKSDVDHFEIEARPTKTLRFTGFVVEPEELKKVFSAGESPGK